MTQKIALDVHAHLIPIQTDALASQEGVSWNEADSKMTIDGHEVGLESIFQPQKLLNWMAAENVEHAWISAPPPTYRQHLSGVAARSWCDYLNDGLESIAADDAERLTALPHLPTQDPAVASNIATYWVKRGKVRFSMPTGTGDARALSDTAFDSLWGKLDKARATIFFHPGSCADGRLKAFYLGNLLGNPSETAVAISHMILGGVLEKYSHITPCFAHGGGTYPSVAGRMQRGFDTSRPGMNLSLGDPETQIPRIFVDCICHGAAQLALTEETFGKNNIVFGSDWPFPMGLLDPHVQLASSDAEQRERLFQTNTAKLLKPNNKERKR